MVTQYTSENENIYYPASQMDKLLLILKTVCHTSVGACITAAGSSAGSHPSLLFCTFSYQNSGAGTIDVSLLLSAVGLWTVRRFHCMASLFPSAFVAFHSQSQKLPFSVLHKNLFLTFADVKSVSLRKCFMERPHKPTTSVAKNVVLQSFPWRHTRTFLFHIRPECPLCLQLSARLTRHTSELSTAG